MAGSDMGSTDSESCEFTCEYCCKTYNRKTVFVRHVHMHTKPFKCRKCDKSFASRMQRTKHKLLHAGVRGFKCSLCPRKLLTKYHLQLHMTSHERGKYKCDICELCFSNMLHVKDHFVKQHGGRNYSCVKCGIQYGDVEKLKSHVKACKSAKNAQTKEYTCKICDKTFVSRVHLKIHIPTHSLVQSFDCAWCKMSFVTRQACEVHQSTQQCIGPTVYDLEEFQDLVIIDGHKLICRVCKRQLHTQETMKRHIRRHFEEKHYICEVCDERFPSENWLKRHLPTHRKTVLRFRCTDCKDTFSSVHELVRHGAGHEGKQFECEYCQKPFGTRRGMRNHVERLHFNIKEKRNACEVCDQEFVHHWQLNNHKIIHGDKPVYSCEFCPLLYKTFTSLDAHMQKEHQKGAFDTTAYIPL